MKLRNILTVVSTIIVVLALAFFLAPKPPVIESSAVPTPISDRGNALEPSGVWQVLDSESITTLDYSPSFGFSPYHAVEVQVVLTNPYAVTHTVVLQHSLDGVNYVDGATIINGTIVSDSVMYEEPNFGRFTRLKTTTTLATPVAVTAYFLGR
jgi:hypothetical protein